MAKKHKCPAFENHERWLISYADMLTLLFAVFVVLYAINLSGANNKAEQVAGSMQESFNMPLEDIPVERQIGPTEMGFGIFEHFKGNRIRPPLSKRFPSEKIYLKIINDEMNKIKMQIEDRLYGPNKFPQGTTKYGNERIVDVQRTEKGFKLILTARYFFESGSAKIKKTALKDLDQIIESLKELGRDLTIEGHTDSIPPRGQMSNWELSTLRATNVLKYMIRYHNFPPSKLSAAGYADTKPIAHNGTKTGRALNRRIEIHINYDSEYSTEAEY